MKKYFLTLTVTALTAIGFYLIAADHIDAPGVASTSTDITDFYAFASPTNSSNLVFVANVQGLLAPSATAGASFDENVLIEFNIDNDGDYIEDLVIPCTFKDGKMHVYGPEAPLTTGKTTTIKGTASPIASVDISTYGANPTIGSGGSLQIFAGPRDDPFFMDFAQYGEIIAGNATSFNNPGSDTFAGTNVLSVVIEVPKSMLGGAATLNTWVESKRK